MEMPAFVCDGLQFTLRYSSVNGVPLGKLRRGVIPQMRAPVPMAESAYGVGAVRGEYGYESMLSRGDGRSVGCLSVEEDDSVLSSRMNVRFARGTGVVGGVPMVTAGVSVREEDPRMFGSVVRGGELSVMPAPYVVGPQGRCESSYGSSADKWSEGLYRSDWA